MASTHGSWVALGKRGRLVCHVRAAPPPSFTWTTEDVRNIHNNEKYTIHKAKLLDELVLWASVLEVEVITQHDYRDYHCSASNDLGTDSTTLTLMPPTHPRPPANFTMVNVSDVSVVLGWSPNLDAGMPHSFTVRYRADGTLDYEYKEADGGSTGVRVEGLSPGVRYTFSVKADNDQGSSDYSTPAVTVTTLGTSISSGHRLTSYLLLVIIMSAMALLVLNVAIIACILQRHKKKKKHPSRCKASSSTKTTSVTTQGGGNTSTSSPEDHHHLHHHHHHHILKSLKSRSSKTTEAYQAEHHNNKGRGQNTNLPRPSASGQTHKSSANKNPKTVRKWTGTLKRRGRIPDTVHLHTQEINKPDSTLSRNRLFGNGRLPNHSKEIVPSTASPEASSLIPRLRDNITPQLQQRNSVLDDDQTSDSSHESTDTAIFCDNSASSPQPSGQTHSHTPKEHDALSYAQQIKEDLQQHERSENIQQALQHGQPTKHPTKQTTQTDSFITLTGAHSSTYHQQQNNYHQAYVSEGAGRDSRPRSNIDSLLAQSITQGQPDRRGNIHTSPRTSRSGILHQQRPNSSPTGALRHHTPDRQQHLPPSSPIIRIQHHKMQLTSPTRVQHRQIVNDSPTKIQKGQLRSDSPTRVQHRQLPLSSPDRDQFRRLLEDSLTKVQHRQLTPDPPPRGQHRRLPTDSPSVVQKHHPARPTSESQKHHSLLADPPTEVQHRPPPVPQSPTRHRSPPTRPKLRYHRPPTPPKLRHHPPPTPPKPSPAQYSPSSKIRHLGQIDKSDNQSISIPEVYQLPHYTDDPNAEDNIIASSAILDSSHQDSTQRAYQLAQNDSCTSQGNMLVSQSLSQVVHAMRETQAPVATSSPITRPRRSRFPDDFIWHGNPGKS
ncbi:trithorax group protein osa-like [Homarus americanus]|nr:trithorax group protein osa-like [Homarus americanus]